MRASEKGILDYILGRGNKFLENSIGKYQEEVEIIRARCRQKDNIGMNVGEMGCEGTEFIQLLRSQNLVNMAVDVEFHKNEEFLDL
jgi:hypothetical protein